MKVKDFKKLYRGTFDICVPKLGTTRSDNEDLDDRVIEKVDCDMYVDCDVDDRVIVYVKEEKSADKMFEELGYIKTFENQYSIDYSKEMVEYCITFWKDDRTVQAYENHEECEAKWLNMQELNAVFSKAKELGWL